MTSETNRELTRDERNERLRALLRSWTEVSEEEAQEQRETFEYLKKALNEERRRIGARLLFPE